MSLMLSLLLTVQFAAAAEQSVQTAEDVARARTERIYSLTKLQ